MKIVLITGSLGLIGNTCALEFLKNGYKVIGIDNDSRKSYFGNDASVISNLDLLKTYNNYEHYSYDITSSQDIENLVKKYNKDIYSVIHCAAQPSHDWSYKNPLLDFNVNAFATLLLINSVYKYSPDAFFVYMSTNKVYGDNPNKLELVELEKRYEHNGEYFNGIHEKFNIDDCTHSIFGVNKLYSDLIVQEYGKNLGIKSCVLRCGCLTGPTHKGAELHGFLSYLSKCIKNKNHYKIYGYKGKQVRDNIHSYDVWNCINHIINGKEIYGEIFNLGGGRGNSISVLEAIDTLEIMTGNKSDISFEKNNRTGDHIWYITNNKKLSEMYPDWKLTYDLNKIFLELI
jgi:CDP-paratose 2-epimerase